MGMETEVKFRMEKDVWLEIKGEFGSRLKADHVERQTNQYYNTVGNELNERRIGLRLRVLEDRSILAIKRDTKVAHRRQEVEEVYEGRLERLPEESPALRELLAEVGASYEDIVPLVMLRAERTVFLLEEEAFRAEVCFDEVAIVDVCREHMLYEVEFELVSGAEERLLQVVGAFRDKYGERVEQSAVSKLQYALELVACE